MRARPEGNSGSETGQFGEGMHLAEFNIGTLKYDWDDARVVDFLSNLDRIYALAMRSPGYVWHLDGDEMEAAQVDPDGVLGGNPRTASTLSVWEDVRSLENFAFNTVHKQFYDRRDEWYDPSEQVWGGHRIVMWWVPHGHRPTVEEAAKRLSHLTEQGNTDHAFNWHYLPDARIWAQRNCEGAAA